jgi:hypothetical protein
MDHLKQQAEEMGGKTVSDQERLEEYLDSGTMAPAPWEKETDPEVLKAWIGELLDYYNKITTLSAGEAGGVAWAEVFTGKGTKISLTERSVSSRTALDQLMRTMKYAVEKYGLHAGRLGAGEARSTERGSAQTTEQKNVQVTSTGPRPQWFHPNTGEEHEVIPVQAIIRGVTLKTKEHCVKVRGGLYQKFPIPAYKECIPDGFDLESLSDASESTPPANMRWAVTDRQKDAQDAEGKPVYAKKVIAFLS